MTSMPWQPRYEAETQPCTLLRATISIQVPSLFLARGVTRSLAWSCSRTLLVVPGPLRTLSWSAVATQSAPAGTVDVDVAVAAGAVALPVVVAVLVPWGAVALTVAWAVDDGTTTRVGVGLTGARLPPRSLGKRTMARIQLATIKLPRTAIRHQEVPSIVCLFRFICSHLIHSQQLS